MPATRHRELDAPAAPAPASAMPGDRGGEAAEHQRALAADHHEPGLRGQRDAERGQHRAAPRATACSATRTPRAEAAAVDQRVDLERVLAERAPRRAPKSTSRRRARRRGGRAPPRRAGRMRRRAVGRRRTEGAQRHGRVTTLADHALDQVVHLLEHDVGLLLRDAGGDDGLAGVVLERALEDRRSRPSSCSAFTASAFFRAASATAVAVGRRLDEAFLEAAAQEVRPSACPPGRPCT